MKRTLFLIVCILFFGSVPAFAEGAATPISCPEDLYLLASDPDGDFVLTEDIYMTDELAWQPVIFRGHLDGQGYTIYNSHPAGFANQTRTVYDGNYKEYEGYFQGFFGILDGAVVENLNLVGASTLAYRSDLCIFASPFAGLMENGAVVRNCSVQGYSDLSTSGHCFGVGGLAGYGSGRLENCTADVILLCIDTDREYKDEQFMGGAYAAGYIDIVDCDIHIDGYDSDHGYVHDGGLVGMYIIYPKGTSYAGQIVRSHVSGRIRFFEDNRDRRAYCAPYIGEVLQWTYEWGGCTEDFERDEVFTYDEDLLPCGHEGTDAWTVTTVEPDYGKQGYKEFYCSTCGFHYRMDYRAPLKQEIELIDPAPIEEALQEAQQAQSKGFSVIPIVAFAAGACIVALLLRVLRNPKGKH